LARTGCADLSVNISAIGGEAAVLRWCRSELNPNYVRKASVTVTFSLCGAFVAHGASGAGLMTDGGVRIREDEPKPRMAAALHRTP